MLQPAPFNEPPPRRHPRARPPAATAEKLQKSSLSLCLGFVRAQLPVAKIYGHAGERAGLCPCLYYLSPPRSAPKLSLSTHFVPFYYDKISRRSLLHVNHARVDNKFDQFSSIPNQKKSFLFHSGGRLAFRAILMMLRNDAWVSS